MEGGTWILYLVLLLIIIKIIQKMTLGRDLSNTCLIGRTVVITGGNRGLGYRTALRLASKGGRIILADMVDCQKSVESIIQETTNTNVTWKHLDLASFASIRKFASEILEEESQLDILINNAGVAGFEGIYTEDGLLKWLQINLVGPFLLTHLLIGMLKRTKGARIVFVSTYFAHVHTNFKVNNLNVERKLHFGSLRLYVNYANSKLCVLAMARKFADKLKDYDIKSVSVHPGLVATGFYDTSMNSTTYTDLIMPIMTAFFSLISVGYAKNAEEGAETSIYGASSPKVKTGVFYGDCREDWVPRRAMNSNFVDEVWKKCEELAQLKPTERYNVY